MENLIVSANAVLPLLLMMCIGYAASKKKLLTKDLVSGMNRILFYIFLPSVVFSQIYTMDMKQQAEPKLILYTGAVILSVALLSFWLVPKFERNARQASSVAQGIFRGNIILFGFAISQAIYGNKAIGLSSLLAAFLNPLCNILAVICFNVIQDTAINYKKMFLDVVKTPTIIATFAALAMNLLQIPLPGQVVKTVSDIGQATTPLALILLGSSITLNNLRRYKTHIFWVCLLKLLVIPVLTVGGAVLLGFRNESLVALFAFISAPLATSSYPVAAAMGGDADLAAQLMIATSVLSVFTIFILLFAMKSFALI